MQGAVLGVGRSVSTLARAVGPAIAGLVFTTAGMDWPFFLGAAVMLAVLLLSLRLAAPEAPRP